MNHHGSLPLRAVHSTNKIVWTDSGDPESVYCPFTITNEFKQPQAVTTTQTSGFFVKQVVFLITVNHRGSHPLRELYSTDEAIVNERERERERQGCSLQSAQSNPENH